MAKSLDYGTVSGQSTGFRGGPVRDGRLTPPAVHTVFRPMSSDEEFTTLQDRVLAAVKEINQQSEWQLAMGCGHEPGIAFNLECWVHNTHQDH